MSLNEAEFEQLRTEFVTVEPDRRMFVIAYALAAGVWAIGFATGLAGFALNRLRRFRRSGAHPYRRSNSNV